MFKNLLVFSLAVLLAVGCAPSGSASTSASPTRPLAATLSPASATNTPAPTVLQATATVPATSVPPCTDRVSFVKDVTIPDGTTLARNRAFTKTWRIMNSGSCNWGADYAVVFASGSLMDAPRSVSLRQVVDSGETVDVSVRMVAPGNPGEYEAGWKMRSAKGTLFGAGQSSNPAFWVKIRVK